MKLRQADVCLKKFWYVNEQTPAYTEEDLIAATDFMIAYGTQKEQYMILYFGISSNQGDHNGRGDFAGYLNLISLQQGRGIVLPAGNEGNAAHHFKSRSFEGIVYQDV